MTFLTLHPKQIIGVLKEALGEPTLEVSFPLNPIPASRPRVTRWGVYYGKTYTQWRKDADKLIKEALTTIDVPCVVVIEQIVKKAKSSKRDYPRGDVDNFAKAPTDLLTTKNYWKDDDQILNLFSSKRFVEKDEEPRTEVSIYAHKAPTGN